MKMFYLQLRNELWKLFGKKLAYIGFGVFLVAEVILTLVFRYSDHVRHAIIRPLERMGYPPDEVLSNLTLAVVMLYPIGIFLMPLYVSLIGGDLMAKEAEDGTLRMILSRPISRKRLMMVKWAAGVVFSIVLIFMLGGCAIGLSSLFFPSGGLFVAGVDGSFAAFGPAAGWAHYLWANVFLVLNAVSMMSLAFMFSCFDMKPSAAMIIAISVFFLSWILHSMPAMVDLQPWFLTYYFSTWINCFHQLIPWWKIGEACCMLFGFNLTFFIVGCTAFQVRDIKS